MASRFVPTETRLQLFDMILEGINSLGKAAPHVVELGTGTGHIARHILERNNELTYGALDFSKVFFGVARETIGDLVHRVTFTNADLNAADIA